MHQNTFSEVSSVNTHPKRKPAAGKYGCFGKADVQDLLSKCKKPHKRRSSATRKQDYFPVNSSFSPRFFSLFSRILKQEKYPF